MGCQLKGIAASLAPCPGTALSLFPGIFSLVFCSYFWLWAFAVMTPKLWTNACLALLPWHQNFWKLKFASMQGSWPANLLWAGVSRRRTTRSCFLFVLALACPFPLELLFLLLFFSTRTSCIWLDQGHIQSISWNKFLPNMTWYKQAALLQEHLWQALFRASASRSFSLLSKSPHATSLPKLLLELLGPEEVAASLRGDWASPGPALSSLNFLERILLKISGQLPEPSGAGRVVFGST